MDITYKLIERIDTTNAEAFNKELEEALASAEKPDNIILDASDMKYISSAGLRVLLKCQKAHGNVTVVNVSPEVYEIFDTTGFNEILNVEKRFRELSVDGCEVIGKGFFGTVYRIDEETIVKVYSTPDSLPMIRNEQRLAKRAFVKGVPTAISYDIVRVGDNYGSVFELLKAKTLNDCLIDSPERFDEILHSYVDFLKKVHGTVMDADTLPMARERFVEYIGIIKEHFTEEQCKKLSELISSLPDDLHMVHGDFQMKNVMLVDNELMLIDMDTLSTGQPIFDLQALYVTYIAFAEDHPNNLTEFLGIPNEWGERIWNSILKEYFNTADEASLEDINNKIRLMAYMRFMFLLLVTDLKNGELGEKRIRRAKERITELLTKVNDLML